MKKPNCTDPRINVLALTLAHEARGTASADSFELTSAHGARLAAALGEPEDWPRQAPQRRELEALTRYHLAPSTPRPASPPASWLRVGALVLG